MNMEARIRGIGMTSMRTRARLAERLRVAGIGSECVLAAMQEVPRHMFVDEAIASRAYDDCSLPIGSGQTISQPYVVAKMTQLAIERTLEADQPLQRVLEIGTGSGYQAAVLAHLGCRVYSLERIRTLAHRASDRFRTLGQRAISVRYANGYDGWQGEGPFDVVMVTAAMQQVPAQLIELGAPRVVYVSCNPKTGAQDVAKFVAGGYELQSIQPVDLFPHTPHVEAIFTLRRARGGGSA